MGAYGAVNTLTFGLETDLGTYAGVPDLTCTAVFQQGLRMAIAGSVLYGAYGGGSSFDAGYRLAVGQDHRIYVVGESDSADFPEQDPEQVYGGGSSDAFVAELSAEVLGPTGPVGTADSGDQGRQQHLLDCL